MNGKTSQVLAYHPKKLLKKSDSLNYEKGLSNGYYFLATYYYDNAKFRESIELRKKGKQLYFIPKQRQDTFGKNIKLTRR